MLAVHLVTVRLLAAAGRLPRLVRRKAAMLRAFTVGFLEIFKSCLLLLVVPPGLIDTLAQLLAWRSLLWLSMMWRWRYLTQSNFLSTTSLAWSLALHLLFCFSQEKPLRWKEIRFQETRFFVRKIENFDELQLPQSLIFFCWNFAHVFYLIMPKKGCSGFFFILFRSWVINENVKYECVETRSFNFCK